MAFNVHKAMDATVKLADARGMLHHEDNCPPLNEWLSYQHVVSMSDQMRGMVDREKLNRWLGWAQCAVVASGVCTSDEMADINRKNTT